MGANNIVVGLCVLRPPRPPGFLAALPVAHQNHSGKSICVALPPQINWLNPGPTVPGCLHKVTLLTYVCVADIRRHFPTWQRNEKTKKKRYKV